MFFGPRLKTEGTYKITVVHTSVRMYVRPYVMDFLRNRSKEFSKTWHEVMDQ